MSTNNPPEETKEGSYGFPAWDTFESQKDGYPLDRRAHLDEVERGPASRHKNVAERDYNRAPAEGQPKQFNKPARFSPPSLKNGEGLEETWTDADVELFRRAAEKR